MENITDANFDSKVLKSEIPVLVDFWAQWCGPCRMLAPVIEEVSNSMHGKVSVVKMNIDENPHTPSSLGIRSIPTMIIFKGGKPIATKLGLVTKDVIEEWINSVI